MVKQLYSNKNWLINDREVVYTICSHCCCSVSKLCLFVTLLAAAHQAPLSSSISQSLLKFMSIDSVMLYNPLPPRLLLPSVFPSIRVFSNELALHFMLQKYCSFSVSINPFNEYSRFISFRSDWFDILVVQRILMSLLQHHNSKTKILWHTASFVV